MSIRPLVLAACACLLLARPAGAQQNPRDPVRLTVAMSGIVVVSAGFAMMLSARGGDCLVVDGAGRCESHQDTSLLVGGVAVVAAGVTMTWLGLRERSVVIVPSVSRRHVGALARVRWGRAGGRP